MQASQAKRERKGGSTSLQMHHTCNAMVKIPNAARVPERERKPPSIRIPAPTKLRIIEQRRCCKVKPEMQASQAKRESKRGSTSLQHVQFLRRSSFVTHELANIVSKLAFMSQRKRRLHTHAIMRAFLHFGNAAHWMGRPSHTKRTRNPYRNTTTSTTKRPQTRICRALEPKLSFFLIGRGGGVHQEWLPFRR